MLQRVTHTRGEGTTHWPTVRPEIRHAPATHHAVRRCRGCVADHRGFSLVDLTLALALAMLLLTASVMGFQKAQNKEQIDKWARSLSSDVAFGQQTAVAYRTTVTVTLTSTSYLVATGGGTALRYAALPSDISLTTSCPTNVCAFDHRGVPTAVGTVTLTSASTGRSYVVTILANTGRVSYQ